MVTWIGKFASYPAPQEFFDAYSEHRQEFLWGEASLRSDLEVIADPSNHGRRRSA